MIDGREKSTPLKSAILDFLNLKEEQFSEAIYKAQNLNDETLVRRELLNQTAPIVISRWETGDTAATDLANTALEEYLITVKAMLEKIGDDNADVVYGGGLIKHASKAFIEELLDRTEKQFAGCTAKITELPPSVGAALLAAYTDGEGIESLFQKSVDFYRSNSQI